MSLWLDFLPSYPAYAKISGKSAKVALRCKKTFRIFFFSEYIKKLCRRPREARGAGSVDVRMGNVERTVGTHFRYSPSTVVS